MNSILRIDSLTINNLATIKNQSIEFSEGFNVIVGETGSGKSLILDALQLTFGARADKKMVRKGSEFLSVEVVFVVDPRGLKKVSRYCDELGFPFEDAIHIKRIIYKEGSSKAFLNHQLCPLSKLNSFTRKFIDLVGQFENQKLLSADYQLRLLDSYSRLKPEFKVYSDQFVHLKELQKSLNSLEDSFKNREREIDYLQFQLNEFSELTPTADEEERLIKEKEILLSAGNVLKVSESFHYLLFEENDGGIIAKLSHFSNQFSKLPIPQLSELGEKLRNIEANLCDVDELLQTNLEDNESVEEKLDGIIDKLDRYQKLKRKFSLATDQLQNKCEKLKEELCGLLNIDKKIESVSSEVSSLKESCLNMAFDLHQKRLSTSKNLSIDLTASIQKLNMEGATIKFECKELDELSISGLTTLSMMAETNPGEGYYKLSDIASGGELSRILLALRHMMTNQDSISVFLFDEIDTGIGGKTAIKIGGMLEEISAKSQVIAITHLPQIASFAKNLIVVEKTTKDSRTESRVLSYSSKKKDNYVGEMTKLN